MSAKDEQLRARTSSCAKDEQLAAATIQLRGGGSKRQRVVNFNTVNVQLNAFGDGYIYGHISEEARSVFGGTRDVGADLACVGLAKRGES